MSKSFKFVSTNLHTDMTKLFIGWSMKICIACLHVGQMLFAGNKYLLLKRITVQAVLGLTMRLC
jgi:hypothetical protein